MCWYAPNTKAMFLWMRTWESDCDSAGVNLVCESVICTETPDDAALEACRALGKALVE